MERYPPVRIADLPARAVPGLPFRPRGCCVRLSPDQLQYLDVSGSKVRTLGMRVFSQLGATSSDVDECILDVRSRKSQ
jgi:hypothetical protein